MIERRSLLREQGFRNFTISLAAFYLIQWMSIGVLPILVAMKFGAGTELVLSIVLRIVPRILLAPVGGMIINRFGAEMACAVGISLLGLTTICMPLVSDYLFFQCLVIVSGIVDVIIVPALLTLRSKMIPEGANIEANTIFQSADRMSKILGPATAGILATAIGSSFTMLSVGLLMLPVAFGVFYFPRAQQSRDQCNAERSSETEREKEWKGIFPELVSVISTGWLTLRSDSMLTFGILIPALCYTLMLGAMTPFLFWLNTDIIQQNANKWTMFLAAQGAGALLGAFFCGFALKYLEARMSLFAIYLLASLLEGIAHLALAFSADFQTAMVILLLAGLPEMVAFVTYFTLVQMRVPKSNHGIYFSLSLPLFDLFMVVGAFSATLYSEGLMALKSFWLLAASFSIVPVLPWLFILPKYRETRKSDAES